CAAVMACSIRCLAAQSTTLLAHAAPVADEKEGPVTEKHYDQCWKKLIGFGIEKAIGKLEGGDKAIKIFKAIGCFGAETTAEIAKKCMSLVCKFAKAPPCAILKAGEFVEACGKVVVDQLAKTIIPNTYKRLIDGYEGINCQDLYYRQ